MCAAYFENVIRVRVPRSLTSRLRQTANENCRLQSDIIREGIVLQIDRLARRRVPAPASDNIDPPEAA